jgi:hypothetical protein
LPLQCAAIQTQEENHHPRIQEILPTQQISPGETIQISQRKVQFNRITLIDAEEKHKGNSPTKKKEAASYGHRY